MTDDRTPPIDLSKWGNGLIVISRIKGRVRPKAKISPLNETIELELYHYEQDLHTTIKVRVRDRRYSHAHQSDIIFLAQVLEPEELARNHKTTTCSILLTRDGTKDDAWLVRKDVADRNIYGTLEWKGR